MFMEVTDARAADRAALHLGTDPTETRLVERSLAVARLLLATVAVFVVYVVLPATSGDVDMLLVVYAAFAVILLLALLGSSTIPPSLPLIVHAVDVGVAAALILGLAGASGPFVFLLYPLFAAAYRWGFRHVMVTVGVIEVLLVADALLGNSSLGLDPFLLRAMSVGATGAAAGYLAEQTRRRRFEDRVVSQVLAQARLGGKLGDTVNLVLASIRSAFRARQVLLVLQEQPAGRVMQWPSDPSGDPGLIAHPEQVPPECQKDYLFEAPGTAWHASARILSWRRNRFTVVALDEVGRRLPPAALTVPEGFIAAHPCRRLIGASLRLSDEWTGRLFVIEPGVGVHREQSARFALHLAHQIGPAVYDHYLARRLRTRAQSLERGRIARELHDGVTQSLLGLEMEIVVLRRRATTEAPQLVPDLARVHGIVRDEVITVRELMEGIRVGDVEAGDLLRHLSDVVDRFSRHTGIAARFLSDGRVAALTPYVRRQMARIVHEALVNVRKHSGAGHVLVRADVDDGCWKLSIEDDGRGFPFVGRRSQAELDALHQGPRTIGERARIVGGVMTVESRPGFGARVEVAVPLSSTS